MSRALKSKEQGKTFVVTFIGVNGVGKSTNLAKVAYMFKNNNFYFLTLKSGYNQVINSSILSENLLIIIIYL